MRVNVSIGLLFLPAWATAPFLIRYFRRGNDKPELLASERLRATLTFGIPEKPEAVLQKWL
ncbi:hypothetical protein [Pararhizobium sp. DWP1-1-3]|uniref:hypothetical protein n=1 Tax=Pararhizobium sp. DWP1-1-3 TaxID=2804652 RepID=UPI003CF85C68